MPKRLIIITSLALVAVGVVVLAVLFVRSRSLADAPAQTSETPMADTGGAGGLKGGTAGGSRSDATVPQAGPCGDGVCSAGEAWCKSDCGSAEDKFQGSITAADVTPTSFKITWRTERPSSGEVKYGLTDQYELGSVASTAPSKEHAVQISGLSPGRNYVVGVSVTEDDGTKRTASLLSFETPSAAR